MEKVLVTKEQEELLNEALQYTDRKQLVEAVANTRKESHTAAAHLKNAMDIDTLIRALYIGYEVEQTPEEQVRELYDMYEPFGIGEEKRVLIKQILKTYGHKVKGVND